VFWLVLAALVWPLGTAGSATTAAYPIAVVGNHFVELMPDGTTRPVILHGVSHSGSEYACVQGWGMWDGPVTNAAISDMQTWDVKVVRIPLNEDCWLGINGVKKQYAGSAYRAAISGYVHRIEAHGMNVILDLHWNAPGTTPAMGQQVMADADHSPAFWRSVATAYKSDRRVMFELYNEPHDISWSCWRDGCRTSAGWRAAGEQQLVDAVRSTGARNVVLVGGLGWSGDLSQWLAYEPHDPTGEIAATWHNYSFGSCTDRTCWNATAGRVARRVPVITTEFGEDDCSGGYVTPFMRWMDGHHLSYLAWAWNAWDCKSGPALISSYAGKPTRYGAAVRAHFRSLG
jgi:aryl-phospho-beta-D-glucosidase BglC (GH1 family)